MTTTPPDQTQVTKRAPTAQDDSGFYAPYAEYAKSLRTWLIAYGIGAPVLVLTNAPLSAAIHRSGVAPVVAYLFLSGVALQILEAMIYKHAMWHLYAGELSSDHQKSRLHRWSSWISDSWWLGATFDIATVSLFSIATSCLVQVLVE